MCQRAVRRRRCRLTSAVTFSSYDEDDEVFVILNEEGIPLSDGPGYKLDELCPDAEYETTKNAIERGLDVFGEVAWKDLLHFMNNHS